MVGSRTPGSRDSGCALRQRSSRAVEAADREALQRLCSCRAIVRCPEICRRVGGDSRNDSARRCPLPRPQLNIHLRAGAKARAEEVTASAPAYPSRCNSSIHSVETVPPSRKSPRIRSDAFSCALAQRPRTKPRRPNSQSSTMPRFEMPLDTSRREFLVREVCNPQPPPTMARPVQNQGNRSPTIR